MADAWARVSHPHLWFLEPTDYTSGICGKASYFLSHLPHLYDKSSRTGLEVGGVG